MVERLHSAPDAFKLLKDFISSPHTQQLQSQIRGIPGEHIQQHYIQTLPRIQTQWDASTKDMETIQRAASQKDLHKALFAYEQLLVHWTHPDIIELMQGLSSTYSDDLASIRGAFIPGGSTSGLFTLFIKELAGTYPPLPRDIQDLDLLMVNDYPHEGIDGYKASASLLEKVGRQLSTHNRFRGERASNIGNYSPSPIPNIDRAEDWHFINAKTPTEVLTAIADSPFHARYLINYFLPSFPPEINQHNRHQLLQALSLVPPTVGQRVIAAFDQTIRNENELPAIKSKYFFGDARVPETVQRSIAQLNRTFMDVRAQAIGSLLNSAVSF